MLTKYEIELVEIASNSQGISSLDKNNNESEEKQLIHQALKPYSNNMKNIYFYDSSKKQR